MYRRRLILKTDAELHLKGFKTITALKENYTAFEGNVSVQGTGAHGAVVPYINRQGDKVAVKFFVYKDKDGQIQPYEVENKF